MSVEETTPIANDDHRQTDASETAEPVRETAGNEELMLAQKQAQEYLEGWQRERAEFSNYRKRVETQLKDSYQTASLDSLKKFLPIIDDFERAMATAPTELADQSWLNGVLLIHRKFQKLLEEAGVEAIDPTGEPFDPNRHEAVSMEDSADHESGHVMDTLQKGYAYGDRVLRPAVVRVAR